MMRRIVDRTWRFLILAAVDVLSPLPLFSLALFFSLGYSLTLLGPVALHQWRALLWLSLLIPAAGLGARSYWRWRAGKYSCLRFSWRAPLPLLPLLALAPVFCAELESPWLQIQWHGNIHVAYAHQIMYAATPIENVFLPGYPASFYWLYHAYFAAISQTTAFAPPLAASLLNMVAILCGLLWIALSLLRLRLATRGTIYLGFLALLVYCAVNLAGPLIVADQLLEAPDAYLEVRDMVQAGGFARLHSVLGKVMNFSSMPLAILSFAAALCVCIRAVQAGPERFGMALFVACVIVGLGAQPIVVMYILVSLIGGLALTVCAFWLGGVDRLTGFRSSCRRVVAEIGGSYLLAWLALSTGFALPVAHFALASAAAGDIAMQFALGSAPDNVRMIFAALTLLLPLFLLQSAFLLRRPKRAEVFIQVSAALGLVLTAGLGLPDTNQYKGVFFVAMLFALSALFALRALRRSRRESIRMIGRAALAALLALMLVKVVVVTRYYQYHAERRAFSYDGFHVNYGEGEAGAGLGGALKWIRGHAAGDAIVLLPLEVEKFAHLMHERQVYVRKRQSFHVDGLETAYERRALLVSSVFSDQTGAAEYWALLDEMESELPGRAFYAVAHADELSPETMRERGAALAFGDPAGGAKVYWLNPDPAP